MVEESIMDTDLEEQIFTCNACRYTFSSLTLPVSCPDCGKQRVRPATSAEIKEYFKIRREIAEEDELLHAANQ